MNTAFKYSVLVARPEDFQPEAVARVLGALRELPWQDALPAAQRCWGIPAEELEKGAAQDLVARLALEKVRAVAIPGNLLEDLPEPVGLQRLDWAADGLRVPRRREGPRIRADEEPERPEPVRVVWERLAVIAAGGFAVEEGSAPRSAAKRAARGKGARADEELSFFVDLLIREPEQRLRIDAQAFDYSLLKERMTYSALENLRAVVAELAQRAPEARLSRGARVLVERRPLREMGYRSREDWERETRWLLALETLRIR